MNEPITILIAAAAMAALVWIANRLAAAAPAAGVHTDRNSKPRCRLDVEA